MSIHRYEKYSFPFSAYIWLSTVEGVICVWAGFPKEYMKGQSALWGSYLLFGYQDLNIYYVLIAWVVFIAINPEGL